VVRDLTAGINWYVSATSKFQLNWVHSKVEDSGNADIWVLRYQFAIQ
jgi:phosphate-selective porin